MAHGNFEYVTTTWRSLGAAVALAACWHAAGPAARAADDSFAADIKAQNARHLEAAPDLPEGKQPPSVKRDWEDKVTQTSWTLSEGPLSLTVTLKKGGPPDALLFQEPIATLSVNGEEAIEAVGSESFPDNPVFMAQIAEMDPSNPYKEIVFSTYTGGAHCCSDTRILASSKDGETWHEIRAGQFDGGMIGARDLDGDGRYELAMRDNAFLYTFGCYACSTAPLQVLQLGDGEMVDASEEPEFRARHVEALRNMVEWAHDDSDRNGYLAGYVAQKIRLGEGAEAWELMLKHYDRNDDWGLDRCTAKRDEGGECPPGKTEMLTYPEALERFLSEAGYELKK